jgi:hypothetical protein
MYWHVLSYPTLKKLVSAIPAGLKCETRNSCACRPFTTMSVISMMLLLHCPARKWSHWVQYLSRLWGGEGWEGGWVQIFTFKHFNTPFRSCFTKVRIGGYVLSCNFRYTLRKYTITTIYNLLLFRNSQNRGFCTRFPTTSFGKYYSEYHTYSIAATKSGYDGKRTVSIFKVITLYEA